MANFHFQLIVSVSFLLNLIAQCSDISASREVLTASLWEDVSLSCLNSTLVDRMSSYRVRWIKDVGNTTFRTIEWPTESLQTENVEWKAEGDGKMCVFLKNLGHLDAGLYKEEVWKGWKIIRQKDIHLKVKDCKILQAVKAAPGYPVTLNCETTSDSANLTWAKLKGKEQVLMRERNNGHLVVLSVNTTDGGWYRCTLSFVTTTIPVAMTTTNPAPEATQQVPSSAPLVASVVSVVIIITAGLTALIIYFKFQAQKSASQLTRHSPIYMDTYKIVSLPDLQDDRKQVNCLYYYEDENISTFKY